MRKKKSRMTRRRATRWTIFQLLLTLLMAVLLFVRSDAPNGDDFLAPIPTKLPTATAAPQGKVEPVEPVNVSPVPEAAPAKAVEAPARSAGGVPAANVLRFAFTQPSWVEVRDKSGNIVFSQLNPGGTQKEVEGTPPFAVMIGNAAHVTLTYQGQSIDISKRSKDDVARLTVE